LPLIIAVLFLLKITVLEAIVMAWTLYIRISTDSEYDSEGYVVYLQIVWIVEIFLQTALLVILLFAPRKLK
jgi:hypothetical protein